MAHQYGADSLRLFGLFVAPFEETVQWTDKGIEAAFKFVNRVSGACGRNCARTIRPIGSSDLPEPADAAFEINTDEGDQNPLWMGEDERKLRRKLHQTIRKVGDDLENFPLQHRGCHVDGIYQRTVRFPQRFGGQSAFARANHAAVGSIWKPCPC